MTSNELRKKFIEFFVERGHKEIPAASLIPENDPSVLFTTAGMHPLVPFLLGEKHPEGKKLVGVQKCLRTDDIDEVGDNFHHTFLEMLGNWSLGDYWKKETIELSYEFLVKILNLDPKKIAISCFAGDEDAKKDQESADAWISLGIPAEKIAFLGKKDNWWGPAGETGPCGPDTEMFYWAEDSNPPTNFQETHSDPRWCEIWNDVFMQYDKKADGSFAPLRQKNVDTGMGLERTLAVINGLDDDYKTELFWPLVEKIEELSGKGYEKNEKAFRVISDHIKASVFLAAEGITPSKTERGYILRRLIRRAVRYAGILGIESSLTSLVPLVVEIYKNQYPEVNKSEEIIKIIGDEEIKFQAVLKSGIKKAEKVLSGKLPISQEGYQKIMQLRNRSETLHRIHGSQDPEGIDQAFRAAGIDIKNKDIQAAFISGKEAFDLYQTFGFPLQFILDMAQKKRLFVGKMDFKKEMERHQELSRTASAGMFKGGLADASAETTRLHTAAHLLLAALRKVLGEHVIQRGSNITAERLRLDFSNPAKLTPEQVKEVEDMVNEQIQKDIPVVMEEMSLDDARDKGAMGVFEKKYGTDVKVYTMGEFSKEICAGPHVEHTGVLGHFKITNEQSSSAGVRRIKAILE